MRLSKLFPVVSTFAALAATPARAEVPDRPPDANDLLGNIVVEAGATRRLPKIAVASSLSAAMEDVTLNSVVRRDLELCGEVEVLPEGAGPDAPLVPGAPVDVKAWGAKGVEAVVRVTAKPIAKDRAELHGELYLVTRGSSAVFDKRFSVSQAALRVESHRLADRLIGALTGQDGGFASHLVFASSVGPVRRIFTIDADGHDARTASAPELSALAPAFGKGGALFYAAAPAGGVYRVLDAAGRPVPTNVEGSVYGMAFSRDHTKVALSIGAGDDVRVYAGADFGGLKPAATARLALHPAFTPSGLLAYAAEGRYGQRVFVDGKAATPEGLFASAPVFCNHPDGVRMVFAAGVGRDSDLVATGERGGPLLRLTQAQGRNTYPACSPDGRLVAFFSTRTSGEGPGLYLMRTDGGRPKRIAPLVGDSLRWDALPPGDAAEIHDGS